MNFLKEDQLVRYSRQIALKEVGVSGQAKLLKSKVLLVGSGGLGSPVASYLAAAGVGCLGLLDSDIVDLSNLNRQILYGTADVGQVKVERARERLQEMNPDISVVTYHEKFRLDNAEQICRSYDVAVDCLDNFTTRFILNDTCLKLKIPLVHAGVFKYYGQTLTIIPGEGPCLRCIYPEKDDLDDRAPNCSQDGLLGPVPGVLGTLQAVEVLKLLLGLGSPNNENILYFDGLNMGFDRIGVKPREGCICRSQG